MRYEPHDYQTFAADFIEAHPITAVFLDMGLGKTSITLTALNDLLFDSFEVSRILVVAPLRVARDTWGTEIEKWDHLHGLIYSVAVGNESERLAALKSKADIYIINRENVQWLVLESGIPFDYDMVVVDELSSFKNHQAKRFRALMKVRPGVKRIVGLTGTPSGNGLMDLFAEFKLLDMGQRLGRFIGQYRNAYFQPDKRNGQVIFSYKPLPGAEEQIYSKISDITITATVTDSRGRVSDAATVTIAVVRYFTPYFERYSSQRCNSAGTLLDDGTYVLGNALYNRAPCENLNQVTRSIFYKKTSDTEWTNSGYIFSSGNPIVFGGGKFSTEYSYDIKYTIQDAFNTVSVIDLISTASVIMDFKSGGKGVAVGKVSETDNVFEVSDKWDVKVYGKLLKDYIQSVAGAIYPVGSIYMSVNPTNPSTYFGGTWVAWGSGRVPVGINTADSNFSTVEKTGGASTVALTAAQMPSHSHDKGTLAVDSGGSHGHNLNLTKAGWGVDGAANKVVVDSTGYTALTNVGTAWAGYHGHTISGSTASAGSGSSHSNLQPYIVCYMWKRTA